MFTTDQLTIYLQDHYAGATVGLQLARRAHRSNKESSYGGFLGDLAGQIEEDRHALEAIMQACDVGPDRLKVAGGWTGEKLGRLKLNGRLFSYAPLSRIVELEGLITGVRGKLALWLALRQIAPGDRRLDEQRLDELIARAEAQLSGLREHHARAAQEAFGGG